MQAFSSAIDSWYLEDRLFNECEDATEYSLRAYAKKSLGLYELALEDLAIASELEPDNPSYYIDMANCLMKLGRADEAMQKAHAGYVKHFASNTGVTDAFLDIHLLIFLFSDLKDHEMTLSCIDRFIRFFTKQLPYTTFGESGSFSIEVDGESYESSLSSFECIFVIIKEIEHECGDDPKISALTEELKSNIVELRLKAGF